MGGLAVVRQQEEALGVLIQPSHREEAQAAELRGQEVDDGLAPAVLRGGEDAAAFEAGMTLGDGLRCLPAGLEILSAGEESEALVTLREGKFHQVKRMLAARGKPVTYLRRVRMGNLTLDPALKPGEYRFLTPEERKILGAEED